LASAGRNDRAAALSAALHGRWPGQSARRGRNVSRLQPVPHPRHQRPSTIGKFVSSGCIRLTNEDVSDLSSRVDIGTWVVVLPKNAPHIETRTNISVRPVTTPARPVATTLPGGRQAMNLTAPQLN